MDIEQHKDISSETRVNLYRRYSPRAGIFPAEFVLITKPTDGLDGRRKAVRELLFAWKKEKAFRNAAAA